MGLVECATEREPAAIICGYELIGSAQLKAAMALCFKAISLPAETLQSVSVATGTISDESRYSSCHLEGSRIFCRILRTKFFRQPDHFTTIPQLTENLLNWNRDPEQNSDNLSEHLVMLSETVELVQGT